MIYPRGAFHTQNITHPLENEIRQIADLIEQLREKDTHFCVFGAKSHRYRIGPTLSEDYLREFEAKHGFLLPPDYRLFLQFVGNGSGRPHRKSPLTDLSYNGGAGPDYGLASLEFTVEEWKNGPFPFSEKMALPADGWHDLRKDEDNLIPGAIQLSSKGCGGVTYLVVQGEAYGTIWNGWEWHNFWPTGLSFSVWIREWAQRNLELFVHQSAVERIQIGMSRSELMQATNEFWEEETYGERKIFGNARLPVSVELDENGKVVKIRSFFSR